MQDTRRPLIVVGSANPNKLLGVRKGTAKMFGKAGARVVGVDVQSGVSPQPFGEEALRGAKNRAHNARKHGDAQHGDYFIVWRRWPERKVYVGALSGQYQIPIPSAGPQENPSAYGNTVVFDDDTFVFRTECYAE